jgi:hypothetical protein
VSRVKALVWSEWNLPHDYGKGSHEANDGFGGQYEILHCNDGRPGPGFYVRRLSESFSSLEAAKLAAQADFERRVVACLEDGE